MKIWRLVEEETRNSVEMNFKAYGRLLGTFISFKYLGWVLRAADDNWQAVVGNVWKARKSWAWLTRILVLEGASPMVLGLFFKAIVQGVILFGSETWVLNPHMGRSLGIFQNMLARLIMGR